MIDILNFLPQLSLGVFEQLVENLWVHVVLLITVFE